MLFRVPIVVALLSAAACGCSNLPAPPEEVAAPEKLFRFDDKRLDEISGMASSLRQPGTLWVHNDSGDKARLFAVDPEGETLGVVEITNAKARDWEEMTSFVIDGTPWLLVADVGDNNAVRSDCVIYLLPEPDPAAYADGEKGKVKAAAVIPFVFEDGARDCEAVAVDVKRREILLISKRTEPPLLYHLPLKIDSDGDPEAKRLVARKSAFLSGIIPPTKVERAIPGRQGRYRSQVTGLDISASNRSAAVLTYGNVWLYRRDESATWAEAFAGSPQRIPVVSLPQAEALCFENEGDEALLIGTEGKKPPLMRYRLR